MRPLLLVLALTPWVTAADTVTLRADMYPPFNGDPTSAKPGFVIDIAKAVLEPAGYTIDYQLMAWSRVLVETKEGHIDGAVGADAEGAKGLVFPDENQGYWMPVFATPAASTWTYAGPASLNMVKKFGIVQDYDYGKDQAGNSYSDWFTTHPDQVHTLKGDKSNELAVGMLSRSRIDVYIEDWGVIRGAIANAGVDPAGIRNAGPAGSGYPLFIAFAPTERGRTIAKLLSDGTAKLRSDGQLATILARYEVKDWKTK